MKQIFSPKQVARAIGASESSVKRWCDSGILPFVKTAGGHRRVPIASVLDFLRAENRMLVRPEELGLPAESTATATNSIEDAAKGFEESLKHGDYAACRRQFFDMYLGKHSIAAICDRVVGASMHWLGDAWCTGELEVFEERRACEITMRLLQEIRESLAPASSHAPLAMGASGAGDPYSLPTRMVEIVLTENGWNAVSLGWGVPLASLAEAVKRHRPRVFWLSVSVIDDRKHFLSEFSALSEQCGSQTALVVGGRALTDSVRREMQYASFCDNLQHLETFTKTLFPTETEVA